MITDPIAQGIQGGWQVHGGQALQEQTLSFDVIIVGSGAGGGVSAEALVKAGRKVALVEMGPLKSSNDFNMDEAQAYGDLYQDNALRQSSDGAISILQGRAVGGSTLVNWTSSFRTPPQTLAHWQRLGVDLGDMAPWFAKMEARLNIQPWTVPPNANNAALARGCQALGLHHGTIARNVFGCWNLGYCGMGCPTNAKQSMLVTTIKEALAGGLTLFHSCPVEQLLVEKGQVRGLKAGRLTLLADKVVLCAGAIGTPALLLRSGLEDDAGRTGAGTCLHPVVMSFAQFDDKVEPYLGAPQSVYSDHFQWLEPEQGFKMEALPLHPMITSALLRRRGPDLKALLSQLPYTNGLIALVRDGFSAALPGGRVSLDADGQPQLDYPLNDALFDLFATALKTMMRVQIAAGARRLMPLHLDAEPWTADEALAKLDNLPMVAQRLAISSAHVMGGCAMGTSPESGVCDTQGRHYGVKGLLVNDGSLFPTSIGANPQLSIYALAARNLNLWLEKGYV
ncbi:GMC family oxidoreductase [Gallaecimonas xiamenensis]|uniref:GMC family oxidoreductase n=1 Tax=Gallaecimonas xiamenensis 3-C-1 TaxID=745411 RepID=K2JWK3_9GAMM|nr:GMC family oxidoreductase [Gallaecimonas xiamenensis]EKE69605.1 GMC family oxidoreductase [Gallaecimonas xiamenensis 3-C-1]